MRLQVMRLQGLLRPGTAKSLAPMPLHPPASLGVQQLGSFITTPLPHPELLAPHTGSQSEWTRPSARTMATNRGGAESVVLEAASSEQPLATGRPVLLVDGHGLAFRSYHALTSRVGGGFKAKATGTPTSITAGVIKTLLAVIQDVKPQAVVVAFDKGAAFRKELAARLEQLRSIQATDTVTPLAEGEFVDLCSELHRRLEAGQLPLDPASIGNAVKQLLPPSCRAAMDLPVTEYTYKAGRPPMPDEFRQDLHNLVCLLGALRIPCLSPPHVEADDTLAALARAATAQGKPVQIMTSDQDLLQLVDDARNISVLLVTRPAVGSAAGAKPYTVMREAEVETKMGVPPSKLATYRALVGDTSDNIAGVHGIGPVNARQLVTTYGTLEGMFEALKAGKVKPPRAAKALSAGRHGAYTSMLLSKLGQVPVDVGPLEPLFTMQGCRREEVDPLMQRLELRELQRNFAQCQDALGGVAERSLDPEQLQRVHSLREGDTWLEEWNSKTTSQTSSGSPPPAAAPPAAAATAAGAAQVSAAAAAAAAQARSPSPAPLTSALPAPALSAAQAAAAAPRIAVSQTRPAKAGPAIYSSSAVSAVAVTRVTELSHFPAMVSQIVQQLAAAPRSPGSGLPALAVHMELGGPAYAAAQASKRGRSKSKGLENGASSSGAATAINQSLNVQRISLSWCSGADAAVVPGSDGAGVGNQLSAVVFEFPAGCLLPGGGDTGAAKNALSTVWQLLGREDVIKVVYDAKALHRLGCELGLGSQGQQSAVAPGPLGWRLGSTSGVRAPLLDTMLATYLADPEGSLETDLSKLAQDWNLQGLTELVGLVGPVAEGASSLEAPVCRAVATTAQVWALATQLQQQQLCLGTAPAVAPVGRPGRWEPTAAAWQLLVELEQPLQEVVAGMEKSGLIVDMAVLEDIKRKTDERLSTIFSEIRDIAEDPCFNPTSATQVRDLLFTKLQLPTANVRQSKRTGQFSADEATLNLLKGKHKVIDLMLESRSLNTLLNTYIHPYMGALQQSHDGRVHTTFLQNGATTGRLSSTNPNMQNIPKHNSAYAELLAAYKPAPGWQVLSADYSQMEVRLLAALTGETIMVNAFAQNEDVHKETAKLLFGLARLDEVTKQQRQTAKVVLYGIIYGMGPTKLAEDLGHGKSQTRAKQYIKTIQEKCVSINDLMERNKIKAVTQGYLDTLYGRRRYFDFKAQALKDLRGMDPSQVSALPKLGWGAGAAEDERTLRQAGNFAIQGTSADIIKRAMVQLGAALLSRRLQSRMLLTVHDSLVLEVCPGEEDVVRALVEGCMNNADGGLLRAVPLRVDIKVAPTFDKAYS